MKACRVQKACSAIQWAKASRASGTFPSFCEKASKCISFSVQKPAVCEGSLCKILPCGKRRGRWGAKMRRDELTRAEIRWEDVRRVWAVSGEKRWEDPRWADMSCRELGRFERGWDELRRDEKSWGDMSREESSCDSVTSSKELSKGERRDGMRWDEVENEKKWDELRWDGNASISKRGCTAIRTDEMRKNQKRWRQIDKSRDCCHEAQEACPQPIGL